MIRVRLRKAEPSDEGRKVIAVFRFGGVGAPTGSAEPCVLEYLDEEAAMWLEVETEGLP